MASVKSPIRRFLKPLLYRLMGPKGYFLAQVYGKTRDIRNRLVEEPEMALLDRLVCPGDDVIDIGANFGYYAVRLADLVGSGHVYAFEPIPFTHDVCARVLQNFRAGNTELFQKGVGEKAGDVTFSVPLQEFGALSAGQAHMSGRENSLDKKVYNFASHTSFTCDVVTIDEFLLPRLQNLSFIKMDIEGAELFALRGMQQTLEKFRPTVLIEIEPEFLGGFGIKEADLTTFFADAGYKAYLYDSGTDRLQEHSAGKPYCSSNYILIHKDKERVFSGLLAAA